MNEIYMYLLIIVIIVYTILYIKLYFKLHRLNKLIKELFIKKNLVKGETGRIRKRYIVFSIISNRNFNKQLLEKTIRDFYRKYFGELMLIQADPQLIYFDQSLQRGIVRTTHLHKESVITTLSLIRKVDGEKCLIIPLKTTGTIKKARKILYRLHKSIGKT